MNSATQWRIEYAKALCDRLAHFEQPHTILIGGSVAKGWADEFSDLEMCFIWHKLPSFEDRVRSVEKFGGVSKQLKKFDSDDSPKIIEDSFDIETFHIDLWHCEDKGVENDIEEINANLNTRRSQGTLYTVQKGIVLKDSAPLQRWREKLRYPRELQIRYVTEHLSVVAKPDLLLHVQREDVMIFYGLISGIQKRIIHVLHGLNGEYFQGLKNTKHVLMSLDIKPVHCWERFRAMYQGSIVQSASQLIDLIVEVIDLLQVHLPEIDVTAIRSELNTPKRFRNPQ